MRPWWGWILSIVFFSTAGIVCWWAAIRDDSSPDEPKSDLAWSLHGMNVILYDACHEVARIIAASAVQMANSDEIAMKDITIQLPENKMPVRLCAPQGTINPQKQALMLNRGAGTFWNMAVQASSMQYCARTQMLQMSDMTAQGNGITTRAVLAQGDLRAQTLELKQPITTVTIDA